MPYTVTPAMPMKTSARYGASWVVKMRCGIASRIIYVMPSTAQAMKWMTTGFELLPYAARM